MARVFEVHPDNPQPRSLSEAVHLLRQGGVMVYPTDSCYAIGCMIGNKDGMAAIRQIRGVDENHLFTLICRDLSEIARYARVDNSQYRFLKAATPGSYTFILEATREVPRRLLHPKRSTIGLRVPDHKVITALLKELDEPILSMTLQLPGHEYPLNDPDDLIDCLDSRVEVILTCGHCGIKPTTVIDLTGPVPELIRQGAGDVVRLGIQ